MEDDRAGVAVMDVDYGTEDVGGGVRIAVSSAHTFGTDSFLLSYFAAPRPYDLACDLCAGCGIVPLLWFRDEKRPKEVWAVDVQEQAVRQMERTVAQSAGLAGFHPVHGDLRDLRDRVPRGTLHLVTCNPPYKAADTGLLSAADTERIARHEILCTLDDVAAAAARLLRFGGRLCICQLPERLADVFAAMRRHNIEPKRLRFAQGRPDKAPWLALVEGKLGAKPFLRVETPLVLREGGVMTEEMRRVYRMYGFTDDQ